MQKGVFLGLYESATIKIEASHKVGSGHAALARELQRQDFESAIATIYHQVLAIGSDGARNRILAYSTFCFLHCALCIVERFTSRENFDM